VNRGTGPAIPAPRGIWGNGGWTAFKIRVQTFGDLRVPKPIHHSPFENLMHDQGTFRVGCQLALGSAFSPSGRHGMWNLVGNVPVGGSPDVPSLFGVFTEAIPGLLQKL
jgi:hypothetical protein